MSKITFTGFALLLVLFLGNSLRNYAAQSKQNAAESQPAGRVDEGGVVREEPEVVGAGAELAEIHGADGAVDDGQFRGLAGAVVGDRH